MINDSYFGSSIKTLKRSPEFSNFDFKKMDHEWLLLFSALHEEILKPENIDLRTHVQSWSSVRLQENLTKQFIRQTQPRSQRLAKLYRRFQASLEKLLIQTGIDVKVIDNLQDSLVRHKALTVEEYGY